MPQYHFESDIDVFHRDGGSRDCADTDAALTEVFRRAAAYAGEPDNLRRNGIAVMTVRDDSQSIIFKLRLACQLEDFRDGGRLSIGGIAG